MKVFNSMLLNLSLCNCIKFWMATGNCMSSVKQRTEDRNWIHSKYTKSREMGHTSAREMTQPVSSLDLWLAHASCKTNHFCSSVSCFSWQTRAHKIDQADIISLQAYLQLYQHICRLINEWKYCIVCPLESSENIYFLTVKHFAQCISWLQLFKIKNWFKEPLS